MVVIKKDAVVNLLLRYCYDFDLESLFQRLIESLKRRNDDPNIRELIIQTCQDRMEKHFKSSRWDQEMGLVATIAIKIDDQNLFTNFIDLMTQSTDETKTNEEHAVRYDPNSDSDDVRELGFPRSGFNEKSLFALGEFIRVPLPVVLERR